MIVHDMLKMPRHRRYTVVLLLLLLSQMDYRSHRHASILSYSTFDLSNAYTQSSSPETLVPNDAINRLLSLFPSRPLCLSIPLPPSLFIAPATSPSPSLSISPFLSLPYYLSPSFCRPHSLSIAHFLSLYSSFYLSLSLSIALSLFYLSL